MNFLEWVMKNRYVVAILFTIGAFTTLYQFFKDGPSFLKKQMRLPVWLIFVVVFVTGWLGYQLAKKQDISELEPKDYEVYQGETFGRQPIDIAGKRFLRCKFEGTTFLISGLNAGEITECDISADCKISYTGPAQTTLRWLETIYKIPEIRPSTERLFDNIKKGTVPTITPVNPKINL